MMTLDRSVYTAVKKLKIAAGYRHAEKTAQWRCFSIANFKIAPPQSCELNAVDHCNIACLDCNHASPLIGKTFADPDRVYNDFSRMAKVYHADWVKILGGEPLLHPDLPSLIHAVRKSGISRKIRLVTNGILLHRMPDAIWKTIDQLEVSMYPETHLKKKHLQSLQAKAARHRVKFTRYFYKNFRITFSSIGTQDNHLVRRIYRACRLANQWGCQSIHQGYFFKCPQSIYIPNLLTGPKIHSHTDNGVAIQESNALYHKIVKFLSSC